MQKSTKDNLPFYILMAITFVLLTIARIYCKQPLLRTLPLYISLVVGFLQSRVNRYAPLIGGFNSLLYAYVYYYFGLYAMAAYALLASCPIQLITFVQWNNRAYKHSTVFRCMTTKQRIWTTIACVAAWLITYFILKAVGSSYQLLDNTIMLFGVLISILTMFAFIEYTYLIVVSSVISIYLHAVMLIDKPEQLTYLIFSIYSLICITRGFFQARALYKEQQALAVSQSLKPKAES